MSTEKKRSFLVIIVTAVVFTMAAVGGYVCLLLLHDNNINSNSSITKVESENDAKKGDVDVSLQYKGYATLLTDEKLITLDFTNPSKSKKSLSLEIVANINGEDVVLAKSDRIYPGYKIDSTKSTLEQDIPKGNYQGKYIIHFYNEQDEEEIINSEIAINIYVK